MKSSKIKKVKLSAIARLLKISLLLIIFSFVARPFAFSDEAQIENPYTDTRIYKQYSGAAQNDELTETELKIVEDSKKNPVSIGVVDSSAPLFYLNKETGGYDGITVEMLKLVAKKTGLNYKLVSVDNKRAPNAKKPTETSPRVVVGITRMNNLKDTRNWYLSNSIISDSLVLVGKRGRDITKDASNKTLAIMIGFSIARSYAEKYLPDYKIIECKDLESCLTAIEKGDAAGTLYLRSCVNYLLQKPYFGNLEIIPSFSDDIDTLVAAFVKENEPLIRIVNKGLNMISEEENRTITLNYTVMNPYKLTMADILYKYRTPIIIIFLLILVIIASLSTLFVSKQRTAVKLQEAYEQEKAALKAAELASAAKGNFMARMSHEIRTPLNAIIGYNSIATNELSEAKTDVERIEADTKALNCLLKSDLASKSLLTIINDVLDMSAIESGKIAIARDRFDFKNLVSSISTIFYAQAKTKGVDFDVVFDSLTEEWFVGDQLRINQVLTNIISNAIKFTSKNGKVTFKIKQTEVKEKVTDIHFEISDTGIGMSQDFLSKIWDPFAQADTSITRRFGGTGLGMTITKNLVDLMGGVIKVESEQDKGTCFTLDLSLERTEQPEISAIYDFKNINALIIDDDPSNCDYISLLFSKFRVKNTYVYSGNDAIEAFKKAKDKNDEYTVCLVDWKMPEMDGIETTKRLREIAGEQIPIIVMSAYDYTEIASEAKAAGVNMFISKPLFQSSLFDLLVNVSGNHSIKEVKVKKDVDFTGTHIMIVEDNEMNMEIIQNLLTSVGFTIDDAWNGKEAVEKFNASEPDTYKLILMDVQMPVMNGLEATRAIRTSSHPDAKTVPIVAMTADAFAENITESLASGMNGHISKPIDLSTLFESLRLYVQK